jgi:dipeptide/tripeptide permease
MMLWIYFFLIIFINGFEAGGYQASLYSIGQTYDLSVTSMGLFASVELFATMLAPLIVDSYLKRGISWRTIFLVLTIGSLIAFAGVILCRNSVTEEGSVKDEGSSSAKGFVISLISVIILFKSKKIAGNDV